MNTILRSCVFVSSFVATTTVLTGLLTAAPLKYEINLKVDPRPAFHPFAGSTLQLNITWDAEKLPPSFSTTGVSRWRQLGDTSASLTVMNSTNADGAYDVYHLENSNGWATNNSPTRDSIDFPEMFINMNGDIVRIDPLQAMFDPSFFNTPHPYIPRPFARDEATWETFPISFFAEGGGTATIFLESISGSAKFVPEPATLTMGSLALLSLATLRRRK